MNKTFNLIKWYSIAANLTHSELAEELGVSKTTVSKWLSDNSAFDRFMLSSDPNYDRARNIQRYIVSFLDDQIIARSRDMSTFNLIEIMRDISGLSQKEFGILFGDYGVTQQTISNWENYISVAYLDILDDIITLLDE
jgi:DNA-binding transcriptional regulator YiaG